MIDLQDLCQSSPIRGGAVQPSAPLQILLAEDDDGDALLITRALLSHPRVGEVARARDGVAAIEMIDDGSVCPSLAIIDLQMPRMNGFGLLSEMAWRHTPPIPRLVLTSSSAPTDVVRSRLRGAFRVICKPHSQAELESALYDALAEFDRLGG